MSVLTQASSMAFSGAVSAVRTVVGFANNAFSTTTTLDYNDLRKSLSGMTVGMSPYPDSDSYRNAAEAVLLLSKTIKINAPVDDRKLCNKLDRLALYIANHSWGHPTNREIKIPEPLLVSLSENISILDKVIEKLAQNHKKDTFEHWLLASQILAFGRFASAIRQVAHKKGIPFRPTSSFMDAIGVKISPRIFPYSPGDDREREVIRLAGDLQSMKLPPEINPWLEFKAQ